MRPFETIQFKMVLWMVNTTSVKRNVTVFLFTRPNNAIATLTELAPFGLSTKDVAGLSVGDGVTCINELLGGGGANATGCAGDQDDAGHDYRPA